MGQIGMLTGPDEMVTAGLTEGCPPVEKSSSHLSTLIGRIKRMEKLNDTETPVFKGRLLNLAEYMLYSDDWTDEESKEAKAILDKYNFDVELSHQGIERKHSELRGLPDMYRQTCMRCGRHLSNKYSIQKGMGPFCRSRATQGDWGKDDNPPQPGQDRLVTLFG